MQPMMIHERCEEDESWMDGGAGWNLLLPLKIEERQEIKG
jgi:hypothetical protein